MVDGLSWHGNELSLLENGVYKLQNENKYLRMIIHNSLKSIICRVLLSI